MPSTVPGLISTFVALAACGYAIVRGRAPERIAGAAIIVATLLNVAFQDRAHWYDPQRRQLAIDAALMLVFAILASTSRRKWLIPAAAAQLATCMVHFIAPFATHVHPMALLAVENALGYALLAPLAYGAHRVAITYNRADGEEALREADHLVSLYGQDVAYEVACRHYEQATGRRRAVLARVMMDIGCRREDNYRGDTATPWR